MFPLLYFFGTMECVFLIEHLSFYYIYTGCFIKVAYPSTCPLTSREEAEAIKSRISEHHNMPTPDDLPGNIKR